jgi:WD40 repeat protein
MRKEKVALLAVLLLLPIAFPEAQKSSPLWKHEAGDGVNSVSISSDGKWLVAGGNETYVWVFRNDREKPAWKYQLGGYSYVNSVAISADGSYFLIGCNDGKVILYQWNKETSTATLVWTYYEEGRKVSPYPRTVAISGDGSYMVVGMTNGEVAFFSKESGRPLWIEKCGYQVISVAISRDGKYAVAATDNGAFVFNKDGKIFSIGRGSFFTATAVSDDGSVIAVGNRYGKIVILDPSGKQTNEIQLDRCIWSLDITPDGRYVVAATGEQTGKIFKCLSSDKEPSLLIETNLPASAVSISSDGSKIFAADAQNVYFLENGQTVWQCHVVKGLDGNIECVDMSDTGDYMVACTARSEKEHNIYFFQATPIAPREEQKGINIMMIAGGLIVVALVIALLLRHRISREIELET